MDDPATDPPPSIEVAPTSTEGPPPSAEPQAAHAATASPGHGATHLNHPPYAEMIATAIRALNEKRGSSSRAIAKYIQTAYSNLPHTHSALLTHHLRRLKNNGHLVMVKHSYKLPKSASIDAPKRGPGRPPKLKPSFNNGGHAVMKRGPGRPPKPNAVAGGATGLPRRGPGRPPKPIGPTSPKRPRGRPPKASSKSKPLTAPSQPRPRGRPKKIMSLGAVISPVAALSQGRPRGRPRKNVGGGGEGGSGGAGVDGGVQLPVKRRGRPPKVGGPVKAKSVSGRPVGRPRKMVAEE